MAAKEKRKPKYQVMLVLKDEYKKPGRPDKFELNGNNLEKLLLFMYRHTKSNRHPWQYASVWRNSRFDPYDAGELLFWTRLPY